jgi:hypothetical protein
MNTLQHFLGWLDRPIEEVTPKEISTYIDSLLDLQTIQNPETWTWLLEEERAGLQR